jgi:hypothetical protein
MGANAQTSVPAFVTGQVLTAQQQTEINTGIPVFATSVERDAAFGGTGEKVLAQGQMAFIESSNTTQYYDGATWESLGGSGSGLTLVKTQTIGSAVSSVVVSDAFSTNYNAYKIIVTGGAASTPASCNMTLGAAATAYYLFQVYGVFSSATVNGFAASNATSWGGLLQNSSTTLSGVIELQNPFTAENTFMQSWQNAGAVYMTGGELRDTTSYTAFTLTCTAGTITGGFISVYGYTK